jgi:hypothetical protein
MTNPLRRENFDEAKLTTADIAQGTRPTESKEAPKPVRSERSGSVTSFPERTNPSSLSEQEATSFPQRSSVEQAESRALPSPSRKLALETAQKPQPGPRLRYLRVMRPKRFMSVGTNSRPASSTSRAKPLSKRILWSPRP